MSRRSLLLHWILALAFPSVAASAEFGRIEAISGDRQIAVNTRTPPQPYVVRVLDSVGNPMQGIVVFIGSAGDPGTLLLQDEFRFRGFNTPSTICYECVVGFVPPAYLAVTGPNGIAQGQGDYADSASSAFAVGAAPYGYGTGSSVATYFAAVMVKSQPAGKPSVLVEYFHAPTGHYFNTLEDAEIAALDTGRFTGWKRSPGAWIAYAKVADAPAGTVPVCRFWSAAYTSHFYTADPAECAIVMAKWSDVWTLETREAFYTYVPDKATGACAAGLQPVYRMYNNRPVPNHRYITDKALRDRMTGTGWRAEGYGPDAVMLCAPA